MQTLRASGGGGAQAADLWFDAWVYARQEITLWRALLLRVVVALRACIEKYEPGNEKW